jgi:hypothetical protein
MRKMAVVAVLLSGCSLALQSRPAPRVASSCSTTHAYWIADAVGLAAGVAAVVVGASMRNDAGNVAAGVGGLGVVVYGASMGNGLRWRRECVAGPALTAAR